MACRTKVSDIFATGQTGEILAAVPAFQEWK